MKRYLWATVFSILLVGSAGASASPAALPLVLLSDRNPRIEIAPHAEYLLDPAGSLRYEDVAAGAVPFLRHRTNSFQFSFHDAVLWIRCRLAPSFETGEAGRLVFDNPALGSLTLYLPVLNRGVPETIIRKGGWQAGGDAQTTLFLYPTFEIPKNLDDTRPVFIRVSTPFALQFRATYSTHGAFVEASFSLFLIIGFCVGILVAMLLYNLVLYTFIRERQYIYYLLYVLFLLLWQCVLFGIVDYFWPAVGAWTFSYITVFALLMMIFSVLFAVTFLETSRRAPRHHLVLRGLVACYLAIIVLNFLQYRWIGHLAAYLLGQVGTVALFTAGLASLRSGFKPARYYLLAASVFLGASLVFLFKFYGLIPNNTFTMHAQLFGAAAEAVLLSFALGYRIKGIQEEGLVLRERERSLTEMVVTDDLTGLLNRRFFVATLEKRIAESARTGAPLALLVMDVDHFKRFNDAYGHAEGDTVLKALGAVFQKNLRESDIACRYGGEEFVAILSNTDLDTAREVAERIRLRFGQEVFAPRKGTDASVSISIGACQWRPGESGEDLFKRCDRAMYRAKETGRNRVCSA